MWGGSFSGLDVMQFFLFCYFSFSPSAFFLLPLLSVFSKSFPECIVCSENPRPFRVSILIFLIQQTSEKKPFILGWGLFYYVLFLPLMLTGGIGE